MRQLVINADDLGLSAGVNEGILGAHCGGVVTSASLMVNVPAAEQAAELAGRHPALSVGLHFVREEGVDLDDPDQAAAALALQLGRFRELTGAEPTHVDSHHHVHAQRDRISLFARLVEPLGVPLRHDGRVRYIGGFHAHRAPGASNLDYVRMRFLLHLVDKQALDGFNELACHPGRVTGELRSSYLAEREVELATLTEPRLGEKIEALGVELVSYRRWPPQPAHLDQQQSSL